MKVLLTGAGGQLGRHVQARVPDGVKLVASARAGGDLPCDLTDEAALEEMLAQVNPDLIINTAAWTAVDAAEDHADQALLLNRDVPARLAAWCRAHDALLITYSTDYVFSGQPGRPWREDDPVAPESVYGLSKMSGEREVLLTGARALIVRTAWVYSALPGNFLSAILARAGRGDALQVVSDQTGSPTWAGSLADASWKLVERYASEVRGPELLHVVGKGAMNWHELACLAVDLAARKGIIEAVVPVEAISSDQWPQKARRPDWSVLDCQRYEELSSDTLSGVQAALEDCLNQWNNAPC
jgi:dTDP-4-dehydrorhamnose reductase